MPTPAPETNATAHKPSHQRRRPPPRTDAFAFTILESQQLGGPSRSQVYRLFASGHLRRVKVAGRTLICGDSLRKLLGVAGK